MYAEFSYDLVPGSMPNADVLTEILSKFELKRDDTTRLRCDVLSDTFICELDDVDDFDSLSRKLSLLRTKLGEQFNFTLSLHRSNDPMRIRGTHDESLARRIIEG